MFLSISSNMIQHLFYSIIRNLSQSAIHIHNSHTYCPYIPNLSFVHNIDKGSVPLGVIVWLSGHRRVVRWTWENKE